MVRERKAQVDARVLGFESDRREFSLMQWNVQSSESMAHVGTYLSDVRPDIICLQEVPIDARAASHDHTTVQLARRLGYACAYVAIRNVGADGSCVAVANAILSAFPIEGHREVMLSAQGHRPGYEDQARGYVEAVVRAGTSRVRVGTVHLGYSRGFEMTARRMAEANHLVDVIAAHGRRFVLSGDFNATPRSYVIRAIEERLVSAGPAHSVPSWTTKPFSYDGFEEKHLRWRVDYVFRTPDVASVSSKMLNPPYSDHRPILVTLAIDNALSVREQRAE